jgi:hypothetical protein
MKRMLSWEVAGTEVDRRHGVVNPRVSWTGGTSSTLIVPMTFAIWSARFIEFPMEVRHAGDATGEEIMEVMYPRCAGLDVHKETVVACVRIVKGGEVSRSARTFATTTASLIELGERLEVNGCTHVAMEATGVYWKPVWQVTPTFMSVRFIGRRS